MSNNNLDSSLTGRVGRLRQLQVPLFLFLGLNFILVAAVPVTELFARLSDPVAQTSEDEPATDQVDSEPDDSRTERENPADGLPVDEGESTDVAIDAEPNKVDDAAVDDSAVDDSAVDDAAVDDAAAVPSEVTKQDLEIIFGDDANMNDPTDDQTDVVDTTPDADAKPKAFNPAMAKASTDVIRRFTSQMTRNHVVSSVSQMRLARHGLGRAAVLVAKMQREHVILRNPSYWETPVHYAVDGVIHTIQPGEQHDLGLAGVERLVEFHKGGDFRDTQYTLANGRFEFTVADEGWELVQISDTERDAVGEQTP